MSQGQREAIGSLPRTFVAIVDGQEIPIYTINDDGTITFHVAFDAEAESESLAELGLSATAAELNVLDGIGVTVTIVLAASATTDGMDITVTVKNAANATVAAVHNLELLISDAATGADLTANAAGTDLAAATGAVLNVLTQYKHWLIQTDANGVFVGTLVDADNPADLYVACRKPLGAALVVQGPTVTASWEGGA